MAIFQEQINLTLHIPMQV